MNSEEALYLLMTNQKKVRDDFRFIDLNTHEKVSIEECYDIVIKDLEILEILKTNIVSLQMIAIFETCIGYNDWVKEYHINSSLLTEEEFNKIKEWLDD